MAGADKGIPKPLVGGSNFPTHDGMLESIFRAARSKRRVSGKLKVRLRSLTGSQRRPIDFNQIIHDSSLQLLTLCSFVRRQCAMSTCMIRAAGRNFNPIQG
jgi:hypothetical protein